MIYAAAERQPKHSSAQGSSWPKSLPKDQCRGSWKGEQGKNQPGQARAAVTHLAAMWAGEQPEGHVGSGGTAGTCQALPKATSMSTIGIERISFIK